MNPRQSAAAGAMSLMFLAVAAVCTLVLQVAGGWLKFLMFVGALVFFVLALTWGAAWVTRGPR